MFKTFGGKDKIVSFIEVFAGKKGIVIFTGNSILFKKKR